MNYVVFDGKGGPSVLPVWVDVTDNQDCDKGFIARNFDPDIDFMLPSLRDARQLVLDQYRTAGGTFRGTIFPLLAERPRRIPLVAVVLSLAASIAFYLLVTIWDLSSADPVPLLLSTWYLFGVSIGLASIALITIACSLSWTYLSHPKLLFSGKGRPDELVAKCFEVWVGDKSEHYVGFEGPSAGLAFFLAMSEAVFRLPGSRVRYPWQVRLIDEHCVSSIALNRNGSLLPVGLVGRKLPAIWGHGGGARLGNPRRLTIAAFQSENEGEVENTWYNTITIMNPESLNTMPLNGYRVGFSRQADLKFVFCRHLDEFIRFLAPWYWRWGALRLGGLVLAGLLIMMATGAFDRPVHPRLEIECEPSASFLDPERHPSVYMVSVAVGETAFCRITNPPRDDAQKLILHVESNQENTVHLDRDERPSQHLSVDLERRAKSFFMTMPHSRPSGAIAVVVTLVGRSGQQWAQGTVFFIPNGDAR